MESEVLKSTIALLRRIPDSEWARNNTGVARSGKRVIRYGLGVGSPDIVGCCRGRFVGVETKAAGRKQSPAQAEWSAEWVAAGAIYVVGDDPRKIVSAVHEALVCLAGYLWIELDADRLQRCTSCREYAEAWGHGYCRRAHDENLPWKRGPESRCHYGLEAL